MTKKEFFDKYNGKIVLTNVQGREFAVGVDFGMDINGHDCMGFADAHSGWIVRINWLEIED